MNREIETDGFITRERDLTKNDVKQFVNSYADANKDVSLIAQASDYVRVNKLIPPPFGEVYITEQGLVLMCKGTYKMLTEGKEQNYEEVRDLR